MLVRFALRLAILKIIILIFLFSVDYTVKFEFSSISKFFCVECHSKLLSHIFEK